MNRDGAAAMSKGDFGWGVGARLIATLSGGQVIGAGPSSSLPARMESLPTLLPINDSLKGKKRSLQFSEMFCVNRKVARNYFFFFIMPAAINRVDKALPAGEQPPDLLSQDAISSPTQGKDSRRNRRV